METLWGSYAILAPDFQTFFAGDTAYSSGLRRHPRILRGAPGRRARGFDLALLPIGAYARAGHELAARRP